MYRWLALLILFSTTVHAEQMVTTPDGDEIPVTVHPADGADLVLWLSSEFGPRPRGRELAATLAAAGTEVWRPDLHAAWFLPVGRYSLNDVDPAAIASLIDAAVTQSGKRVFLMAEGRSVALALRGVRAWQLSSPADSTRLAGLLAFSPRLFVRTPQGGEAAEYLPVARASNLPIYVLQPVDSGGYWRIGEDVRQLEQGGAMVFLHPLRDVSDGFHVRPEYSDSEAAMSRRLPTILHAAMAQLAGYGGTPPTAAALGGEPRAPERPHNSALLRPYPGERQAPPLQLDSLRGGRIDLAALRGKVVLVNFWATWCPPCVEEIPSLQRLYETLRPQGLEILAVDVGETVETMEAFLVDKPVGFPVLMDPEGDALRRWGVYAFPTTLVLDRQHRIRYAVFGAFDWSSDEVQNTLAPLLSAPAD
jgi:thiol-disulfide isomerase/thioredoxin